MYVEYLSKQEDKLFAVFEVFVDVLMKRQVMWDITRRRLVVNRLSEGRSFSIFRVKQVMKRVLNCDNAQCY